MVGHLVGQGAPVAAVALELADRGRLQGFPGDAHAVAKALDAEGFAVLQEALAVVRDDFVQGDQAAVAIHFHQVALEALVAVMEGDDQRIVVLLQQTKIGQDLDRCLEHLGRLRAVLFVEWVGHGPGLSKRKAVCTKNSGIVPPGLRALLVMSCQAWLSGRCWPILAAVPRLS
ncbi:hypothetical protein D3C81_1455200 [compost metagenome]